MAELIDFSTSVELNRERVHEQVADSIEELIAEQHLPPGTQLPSGRVLAEQFGVSRATVTEAIRLLEERGLIRIKVGSGTYVADKAGPVFIESMERLFVFGGCSHEDLMTFREVIEPGIAARAAETASSEDLASIRRHIEDLEEAWYQGDAETHAVADASFHEALARATGNELLIAVMVGIQRLLRGAIDAQYRVSKSEEEGVRSHRPIFDAVVARDPDGARAAMKDHIRFSRVALRRAAGSRESNRGVDNRFREGG